MTYDQLPPLPLGASVHYHAHFLLYRSPLAIGSLPTRNHQYGMTHLSGPESETEISTSKRGIPCARYQHGQSSTKARDRQD